MSGPALPRGRIMRGDARRRLQELPSGSVDCVVTSPPYFRLRDYGDPGQLGNEFHVASWVAGLRSVAVEIERVLTPTGTWWLNLGDSYATHLREGASRKSLLLGPERLAMALLADGWLLRNKVIWTKPSVVPTSAGDRLRCSWEVVYLLTKQPQYFFDLNAIRQPHLSRAAPQRHPKVNDRGRGPNAAGTSGLAALKTAGLPGHPLGKNPGDVWRLSTSSFRGDHPAMFPVSLAARAIRAGCPERRCRACRSPYRRRLQVVDGLAARGPLTRGCACNAGSEPGVVLDPFMGSGTTAVAAESTGRDWIGIELSEAYAVAAEQRITHARTTSATNREEVTMNRNTLRARSA